MAEDDAEPPTTDLTLRTLCEGHVVFGRYRLDRVLGQGGMGIVWRARDQELNRDVALKFAPEVLVHDEEAISDLKRETSRCLELTHPNIVRIYDIAHDRERVAISMELVDGGSLSSVKVNDPARCLSIERITPLMLQLLDGLEYAHSVARIVHRDLKPANLMMTSSGRLKIADFGIASSMSDSASRVSLKPSSGTVPFMGPQQAFGGMPAPTDDLYSFGATVYDLVTGKPPFFSGNILHQLEHIVPPSMAQRRTELGRPGEAIPPAWEEVVAACLAKEAKDRPSSAAEVRERLGGAPSTRSVAAGFSRTKTANSSEATLVTGQSPASSRSAFTAPGAVPPPLPPVPPLPTPPVAPPRPAQRPSLALPLILLGTAVLIGAALFALRPGKHAATGPVESIATPVPLVEATPGPGRIVVNTVPSGAKITLDGFEKGLSPLLLDDISPGAHRISLAHEGYEQSDLVLDVQAGKTSDPGAVQLIRRTPTSTPVVIAPPVVVTPTLTYAPTYAPPPPAQTFAPTVWLFPDSSSRRLSRGELAGLSADQLYRARNEIYARRGLIFSTPKGRNFAATLGSYYHPSDANQDRVYSRMNTVEQANVDLIRSLEAR
jgi:serine/threonine protein kinase